MSQSTSVMKFEGTLSGDQAEALANRLISGGDDDRIVRLFQSAGLVSTLLVAAGERALPFTLLYEGSTTYAGVSDPTWSIDAEMVKSLSEAIKDLDDPWARKILRPKGRSYIREIKRAKAAGATAYARIDPAKLYEDQMTETISYFEKLKKFIRQSADENCHLLICSYEDW